MGFRSYFERVGEGIRTNMPEGASRTRRAAVILAELIIGLPESQTWKTFPKVDSSEVGWNGPDTDPDVIEQELQEIEHESAASR